MVARNHPKSRSSRKNGLVKNTFSVVKNVGDKSVNGVKHSVGEVVSLLKNGASLTADGFQTGIKNTSRFLKKKNRTRKHKKSKRNYTHSRRHRK